MNVHFPVSTVIRSIVELELESGSVPDMVISFGHRDRVLRPTSHDPVAFLFVPIPKHDALFRKGIADQNNLFSEMRAFVPKLKE